MAVGLGSLRRRLVLVGGAAVASLAIAGCAGSQAPILLAPAGSATFLSTTRGVIWSFRASGQGSGMLRSGDHGKHWQVVFPAKSPGSGLVTSYFFGAGTAYAVEEPANASADATTVATTDGGTHWWHGRLPGTGFRLGFAPRYQIYFANLDYGWVLATGARSDRPRGAREQLILWRTTDGAHRWTRLALRAHRLQDLSLPRHRGCTVPPAIAFANPLNGWLTEGSCGSGPATPYVWRTSDDSLKWSRAALPAPKGGFGRWQGSGTHPGVVVGAPQVVASGVHAVVLVPVETARGDLLIEESWDGGRHWKIASQVQTGPLSRMRNGLFDPITPEQWVVSAPGKLFETGNGGGTWTVKPTGTRSCGPVSFTDLGHGYMQGRGATIALKTEDGGNTWKPESEPGNAA